MYPLNLPQYEIKTIRRDGQLKILDILRRRYVALTPEEWVRQHFVHFLIEHKGYPSALMANEIMLSVGEKHLRCDSILYDSHARAHMIMEYKAPSVAITPKVFDQISTYNMLSHARYLVVSNGLQHYCCRMDYANGTYAFLKDIPDYTCL